MIQAGYCEKDVLMFILFFAHQCNTTVTIVNAMVAIMSGDFKISKSETFYRNLCRACCECRGLAFNERLKDVGAGIENRHSPSSATVLSEKEATLYCDFLKDSFLRTTKEISAISKHDTGANLLCNYNLCAVIKKKIRNIGPIRSMHLVSLAALVGQVPLAIYTHTPMHNSGGPGVFLNEQMGWELTRHLYREKNDDVKLIGWTASLMKDMCDNFGPEWTPNFLENAACIICRRKKKKDVHYLLPWISIESGYEKYHHQLEFRVFGNKKREWDLICFDGKSKHIILSMTKPSVLKFSHDGTAFFNKELLDKIYI